MGQRSSVEASGLLADRKHSSLGQFLELVLTRHGCSFLGYYDVPRKISSEGAARHLKMDKSTFVEHIRKAERKILAGVVTG